VGVSTVTDPYQPAESEFKLTRRCLEVLSENRFPVSIQTKSDLVLRDIDVIKPVGFEVGVTITTLDESIGRKIEPQASRPASRVKVLEEFYSRGVKTWIFFGPIIPSINDSADNITEVLDVARRTESRVLYDKLNIKRWVLERMAPTLQKLNAELIKEIPRLVATDSDWWRTISSCIRTKSREESVIVEAAFK